MSGTITIFKKELDLIYAVKAPDGRIIRIEFKNLVTVNLYAPTQKEIASQRNSFFIHDIPNFIKASDHNLILLGDFNSIINPID